MPDRIRMGEKLIEFATQESRNCEAVVGLRDKSRPSDPDLLRLPTCSDELHALFDVRNGVGPVVLVFDGNVAVEFLPL